MAIGPGQWWNGLRPAVAMTLGVLLVGLLSLADFLTGAELSFSVFYLLPIYLVTLRLGRWPGFALSLLSALAWLAADLLSGHLYSHPLTPYWNTLVRLALFLVTAHLLSALKLNEERRRAMERVFFHDLLNVAGSIRGFAELLRDYPEVDREEIYAMLQAAAEQSIDEIETQRALTAVEHDEFPLEPTPLHSLELIRQAIQFYEHHRAGRNRTLAVAADAEGIVFTSDQALVNRILGNLVKNALEACQPGETVTVGARATEEGVEFRVHNPAVIPETIREQIFRRTVSTKGRGRGLGTYSVLTLSRYLEGKVSFTSETGSGTTFYVWFPLQLTSED